jgi:hypothetical protein
LELVTTDSSLDASTLKASRDHQEKELVLMAMEKAAEGNVTRAASYLGVSRPTCIGCWHGLKKRRGKIIRKRQVIDFVREA